MIDENGDTVDTFPTFSTLVEETEEAPVINGNSPNNDGNNPNVVVGIVTSKEATNEPVTEEAQEESTSGNSALPYYNRWFCVNRWWSFHVLTKEKVRLL